MLRALVETLEAHNTCIEKLEARIRTLEHMNRLKHPVADCDYCRGSRDPNTDRT